MKQNSILVYKSAQRTMQLILPGLFLLSAIPFLSSCVVTEIVGRAQTRFNVSGAILIRHTNGVEEEWKPNRCLSGDAKYIFGFDLSSSSNASELRVLEDPLLGTAARWKDSSETVVLGGANCSHFSIDLRPGQFINDVREFDAHIDLQCKSSEGTQIKGQLDILHCHY